MKHAFIYQEVVAGNIIQCFITLHQPFEFKLSSIPFARTSGHSALGGVAFAKAIRRIRDQHNESYLTFLYMSNTCQKGVSGRVFVKQFTRHTLNL